jgi:CRP/FNR family transcriptional regulator
MSRCEACVVRDRALCAALPADALQALSKMGVERRLKRGETLLWAGDEAPVCANLQSGMMKLVSVSEEGETAIVGVLFPGDFIGHPFAGQERQDVVALTDVTLCSFPRARFEAALAAWPAMERLLLARTMAELDRTRDWLARMGRASATARVAGFIEDVVRRMGALGCEGAPAMVDLPLSRGEMAELLGLTIETVSRQVTQLRTQGIIATEGTRGLAVRAPARLAAAAGR